jgi:hypothetical protein
MSNETAEKDLHINTRHQPRPIRSRKRLYKLRVGETTYYGPVLQHLVTYLNARVQGLCLHTSGLSDAITGNTRKKCMYKGIFPSRLFPATIDDWKIAAEGNNKIYVP